MSEKRQGSGVRVQGQSTGFRVQGSGFRVQGSGLGRYLRKGKSAAGGENAEAAVSRVRSRRDWARVDARGGRIVEGV